MLSYNFEIEIIHFIINTKIPCKISKIHTRELTRLTFFSLSPSLARCINHPQHKRFPFPPPSQKQTQMFVRSPREQQAARERSFVVLRRSRSKNAVWGRQRQLFGVCMVISFARTLLLTSGLEYCCCWLLLLFVVRIKSEHRLLIIGIRWLLSGG